MNKRIIYSMLLGIPVILVSFISCLREEADNTPVIPRRVILFYMAGDNSLAPETDEKIDALTAAWNVPGDNHLLVYRDKGGDTPACLLEIRTGESGTNETVILKEYGAEDSASPRVFSRVLKEMTFLYPASDYGLIVFSHGTGWLPEGTYHRTRSVALDGQEEMELTDFARAIQDGQFRFIIFESCLMAGAEVAYELKDKTEYILASAAEIVSPGFTPLYGKMLPLLYQTRPALQEVAQTYYEYCNGLGGDSRSATVSLIKTSGLAPLKPLLAGAESHVEHWEWVERDSLQHFDRRQADYLFYDLADYIETIGTDEEIRQLREILDNTILYQAATDSFMPGTLYGFEIKRHCGLTLYIPVARFTYLNARRKALRLFETG